LRGLKRQLLQLLFERSDLGFSLDSETPQTLQAFERFSRPAHWTTSDWDRYTFPHVSVFEEISFRAMDGRSYFIRQDADPPPAL